MANYRIYCDESCHLPNDKSKAMVLGAAWCPEDRVRSINERLREIKQKHQLSRDFEIKWTKVSESKVGFYLDLIDYFFDNADLHFRAVVIPNKEILDHEKHNQTHDDWYYKMYFTMLSRILQSNNRYKIYLDIKDSCSAKKTAKLHEVLCNDKYDFDRQIIERVQVIRSEEVGVMQLADLLIGVLSYLHRGLTANKGKLDVIEKVRKRSGLQLTRNTLMSESKLNILIWNSRDGE